MSANPHLIAPRALAGHLGQTGLSIVDASWYLPAQNRHAHAEFVASHIPGAVFFDQDAVVDAASPLPHTLPGTEVFGAAMSARGIAETDRIVVYDGMGLFSAPRVWWMLRTFGAKDVQILDGGLPSWIAAGLPLESGEPEPKAARFDAVFDESAVVSFAEMRKHVAAGDVQIADARSAERFAGTAPEPRPGVRSGHMPGAHSLPFTLLGEDGRLKPADALRRSFVEAGIDPEKPVVTSCGSGVTAAVLNLALLSIGNDSSRLYDGSWTEWGSAPDTPVETASGERR